MPAHSDEDRAARMLAGAEGSPRPTVLEPPFKRSLKRRGEKRAKDMTEAARRLLDSSAALNESAKEQLCSQVREHVRLVERSRARLTLILIVSWGFSLTMMIPGMLVRSHRLSTRWTAVDEPLGWTVLVYLVISIILSLVILVPFLTVSWFNKVWQTLTWPIGLLALGTYVLSRQLPCPAGGCTFSVQRVVHVVLMLMVGAAWVLATMLFSIIVVHGMRTRARRSFPQAFLTHVMVELLRTAEGARWPDIHERWGVARKLESVVGAMERALRRSSGDLQTDAWVKHSCARIVAALREQKKRVLFPQEDTREEFLRFMTHALTCVVAGRWAALAQVDVPPISKLNWALWLAKGVRMVLTGFAPLAGVVILQRTSLQVSEPTYHALFLAGLLWAAISLLVLIDPDLGSRINMFKDLRNVLPGEPPSSRGSLK